MPCSDLTERIEIALDAHGCLKRYRLRKQHCGRPVGAQALLLAALRGYDIDRILAIISDQWLEEHPAESSVEEFLTRKHLAALQSALAVYTGQRGGGPGEPCTAVSVRAGEDETVILVQLAVDLPTADIPTCALRVASDTAPSNRL